MSNADTQVGTPPPESSSEIEIQKLMKFLSPSTEPGSLGRIAHYEILRLLGHGAYGVVMRARDKKLARDVAIKILAAKHGANSAAGIRFLREARAAAALRHENVVQIYAVEDKPTPFMVMEFIPGESLQDLLERKGRLSPEEVASIGSQVAKGLAAAHERTIIHRDLKPANILVEKEGPGYRAKLADFGLAIHTTDTRLTQSGMIAGTPMYMAPEQTRGETLDNRTDLFSLGSVLFTLTTGQAPFGSQDAVVVLQKINLGEPKPIREIAPDTPSWLISVITKLLEKQPARRFQSASEVVKALTEKQESADEFSFSADDATQVSPRAKPGSPWRGNWRYAVFGLLALTALVGGYFLLLHGNPKETATGQRVNETGKSPSPAVDSTIKPLSGAGLQSLWSSPNQKWSLPEILDQAVNADERMRVASPTLSSDECTLIFSRNRRYFQARRNRIDEPFRDVRELPASIQDSKNMEAASISGDGCLLVYPVQLDTRGARLWVSTRKSVMDDFGEPKSLLLMDHDTQWDTAPVLSFDGLKLFSTRTRGKGDIVMHARTTREMTFDPPLVLPDTVNSSADYDLASWLSSDGCLLITNRGVKAEATAQYFLRTTPDAEFGEGRPFAPELASFKIARIWVSPDGQRMYYHTRIPAEDESVPLKLYMSRRIEKK
jgi:serine/threonine protein kinase